MTKSSGISVNYPFKVKEMNTCLAYFIDIFIYGGTGGRATQD